MNSQENDPLKKLSEVRQVLSQRDEFGRPARMKIRLASNSMSPVLPTGAQAEIEACRLEELQFLDMVVFWSGDRFICHCYFSQGHLPSATGERTFISRGLANKEFDVLTAESNLIGRVVNRKLKSWQYALYRICNRWLGSRITYQLFNRRSGAVKS